MTRNVPEHWVEKLFARMSEIYGARFVDLWRDQDMQAVKRTWAEGLATVNDIALRHGVAALFHEKTPPDLPRFLELCQRVPMHIPPTLPALTQEHRVTETGEAALAKIHALLKPIATRSQVQDGQSGIEWARKILREAEVSIVPLNKLTIAQQAIEAWERSHASHSSSSSGVVDVPLPARVPSPHIYGDTEHEREPGEDDEPSYADSCTNNERERP